MQKSAFGRWIFFSIFLGSVAATASPIMSDIDASRDPDPERIQRKILRRFDREVRRMQKRVQKILDDNYLPLEPNEVVDVDLDANYIRKYFRENRGRPIDLYGVRRGGVLKELSINPSIQERQALLEVLTPAFVEKKRNELLAAIEQKGGPEAYLRYIEESYSRVNGCVWRNFGAWVVFNIMFAAEVGGMVYFLNAEGMSITNLGLSLLVTLPAIVLSFNLRDHKISYGVPCVYEKIERVAVPPGIEPGIDL